MGKRLLDKYYGDRVFLYFSNLERVRELQNWISKLVDCMFS